MLLTRYTFTGDQLAVAIHSADLPGMLLMTYSPAPLNGRDNGEQGAAHGQPELAVGLGVRRFGCTLR